MNDSKLGAALRSVCEPDLELLCSFSGEEYEFSEEFERRMKSVFKPQKRISIKNRIKTALIVAAIFAAGFCLGMANKPLWSYSAEKQDDGRMLSFNTDSVEDGKKSIEERYTLTGVSAGFKRVTCEYKRYSSVQIWIDEADNRMIFFDQCIPAAYRDAYYPDDMEFTMMSEGGIQYMIGEIPGEGLRTLLWYQHGYVFLITSEMSREELAALGRSIEIEK